MAQGRVSDPKQDAEGTHSGKAHSRENSSRGKRMAAPVGD